MKLTDEFGIMFFIYFGELWKVVYACFIRASGCFGCLIVLYSQFVDIGWLVL